MSEQPVSFRNVIFDVDGTLLNTIDDLADASNWVCRNHGWPTHTVEEYKQFVGNGIPALLRRLIPGEWYTPEGVRQILEEFNPYYDAHKEDKTAPYSGISEMLSQLKAAGVNMAVLSNKAHQFVRPLIERYFPGTFSRAQGALDGVPGKPDPILLFRLMVEMGATAEDTLFVGDSNVDIQTAKNAGVSSCGVLWGFRTRLELEEEGAAYLARTPEELKELILGHES